MKDEECARATVELDLWREKQRKTAEENDNQRKQQGAGKHENKPVYQKTERANVTSAIITPLHNTANTTSGEQTLILWSRADLMS